MISLQALFSSTDLIYIGIAYGSGAVMLGIALWVRR